MKPIKKPFTRTCWASGGPVKGFSKEKSMKEALQETIPDLPGLSSSPAAIVNLIGGDCQSGVRPMSIMEDRAEVGTGRAGIHGAGVYFPLDHGAGCRYSHHTQTIKAASRRLKPAFFIPHIQKFFCVKCRVAVRPRRLLSASVTLGAFLFLGGHTMQDKFQAPSYPPPHTVPNPPPPRAEAEQERKQPGTYQEHSRAFCTWYDQPSDILNNAESIIQFLEDVCPSMIEDCGNLGLSKKGMNGLAIIYQTLGETIRAALEGIAAENQVTIAQGVKS